MRKNFLINFFNCGCVGWLLECTWTGLCSLFADHNVHLYCKTSLWMFPIYGLASLILPLSKCLRRFCVLVRGGVYTALIFLTELVTGEILTKIGACPWDYSKARFNYKGLIRLDFIPLWFLVGIMYEKILKR